MTDKRQIFRYKGNKCAVCGLDVSAIVERYGTFSRMFELHHVKPEEKDANYQNIIKRKISSAQLDEVDKCVLLCRCCHGLIHAQNIRATVDLTLEYADRKVSQKLNGWLIHDMQEKSLNFISEERVLLTPYLSKLNDEPEILVFGTEIASGHYFDQIYKSLAIGDVFAIYDYETSECLFTCEQLDVGVKVTKLVRFAAGHDIAASNNRTGAKMWNRNGKVLLEDGEVIDDGCISFLTSHLPRTDK